jgi:hypothetical protein
MLTPQRPLLTEWRRISETTKLMFERENPQLRRSPNASPFAACFMTRGHLKNRAGRKPAFQAPFRFYGNDGTKFPKNCN